MTVTLIELLRWRASEQPERRAYTFLLDGETEMLHLTYAELDRQARAIGAMLQGMRASGERALLLYPPGLDYIAAFFGCLYAGVIPVPVYPPDPVRLNRTLPRLQAIVADAQASVALTTHMLLSMAPFIFGQAPDLAALQWRATDGVAAGAEDEAVGLIAARWQDRRGGSDDLAFLQYTSGSTGSPKGVMLSHAKLLHNLELIHASFGASAESVGVIWLPPYHDMGLIGGILQPLYGGFPVTLMSPVDFLKRPLRWLQAISHSRATISGGPNFAYDLCVRKITPEQRDALDLSCWDVAFNGAEPIRWDTLSRFVATFGLCGFRDTALFPCYGLAEATLIVTGNRKAAPPVVQAFDNAALGCNRVTPVESTDPHAQSLVSSGHGLADQRVVIVDPLTREPCIAGRVGEIWVSGPSVAQGYWRRPDETAQTFQAYLAATTAGTDGRAGPFLRTGDLGFLQGDDIFITGRLKDLIIIRGRNHYPQDIERTVERCHPALRPGCGAAFTLEAAGEEQLVVVHEVERRATALEDIAVAVRAAVAEQHELSVSSVCLLAAGSIPKTSSGKVQRYACRQGFLDDSLEIVQRSTLERAVAAVGADELTQEAILALEPTERQARLESYLRRQIAQALHLDPDALALDRPLTALGLDSLRAIELQNDLEDTLGISLSAVSLLDGLSTTLLAGRIAEALASSDQPSSRRAAPPTIQPMPHNGPIPLSFPQQRLWFMEQLVPGQLSYNIPIAVRLTGKLDVTALEQSLNEIVRRHEILRTTFHKDQSRPVQIVHQPYRLELTIINVATSAIESTEATIDRLIAETVRQPFDLTTGPLLHVRLLGQGATEHVLVLVLHHIIADGWSMGIFLSELTALYTAFLTSQPAPLPPLPSQYADVAAAQQRWFQEGGLRSQLAYWQKQLVDAPPVLELPADYPRPALPTLAGAHHFFAVPQETFEALQSLSRSQCVTLYMTLLSAFLALLHTQTDRYDMIVGTDIANRHWPRTERLIGLFVNQLVLRVDLAHNPTFRELLKRVQTVTLAAYDHVDVPFDKLVEAIKPVREPGRNPLFQVMFVLENAPLPPLGLPGLDMKLLDVDSGGSPFDLSLLLSTTSRQLRGEFRYSTNLFKATTIARMGQQFQMLLQIVVAQPEITLQTLCQSLADADRQQHRIETRAQIEMLQASKLQKFKYIRRKVASGNDLGSVLDDASL